MTNFDPLWVPILTHCTEGVDRLDKEWTAAQLKHIAPFVRRQAGILDHSEANDVSVMELATA